MNICTKEVAMNVVSINIKEEKRQEWINSRLEKINSDMARIKALRLSKERLLKTIKKED